MGIAGYRPFRIKGLYAYPISRLLFSLCRSSEITSTTTAGAIAFLKLMFACNEIPSTLISDNGPQFSSAEVKEFAEAYEFCHITTSP